MYLLKNDLKAEVDSLNEASVMNVMTAYKHLIHSHFPQDLLEEMKEMVVVTVKHNPKNIKSGFLLEFLENIILLNKRRKSEVAKTSILLTELTNRIKEDDEVLLLHKLDRVVAYCDKYLKS